MEKEVYCKELIVTKNTLRGTGENRSSPMRRITQVYEKSGDLIAEFDPIPETYNQAAMIDFAKWILENKIESKNVDKRAFIQWFDSWIER